MVEENLNTSATEAVALEVDEQDGGIRIGDIYIPPPPLPACTFDTKGPRLIITSIENLNFKSYAALRGLGPFHKNFTAIVGPNGSGKSNVIDAMLFVFGYRAKKIRSTKVGVLIHNSDQYPNLTSCTVKVYFKMVIDKGDHEYEEVPKSGFYIARTAYKDNSSVYEINGRRVQFKEVGKLLRGYGIDLDHNRFLILQGEIEMIAMMKPKGSENDSGMLEYLEDIIGCNRFIEPIAKLNVKVEECNVIRAEKINRVKLSEQEKDEVQIARNEAIEYLKMENKVILLTNSVYQIKLRHAEGDLKKAVEEKDVAKNAFETLNQAQEELKANRILKDNECEEIRVGYEKCTAAVEECNEKYSALERRDVACRDNINNHKTKLKRLIKALEAEEEKVSDLKKQPSVHNGEAEELVKRKEQLERKKETEEANLKEVMASMKQETAGLQVEKDKYEAKLTDLRKVVNETKSEMDIAQSELDLYVSNERSSQSKLKELEDRLSETTTSIKNMVESHEDAEKRFPECENKVTNYKNALQVLAEKENKISREVQICRMKVEEAKANFNSNRHRGAVMQALMQQKESGAIPGIFGRLGDLGGIDEKYDVAISTACGSLDNIVTDTMATAKKCVEYLKQNNKGYATFIALDKMKKWEPYTQRPFTAPENVQRLFDLVKVNDQRVLPAFYFALRDTLVTNNLQQATRVGLHGRTRYRCVTLKGEIVDIAGTMTGGGGRTMRGRMGRSVTASDVTSQEIDKMTGYLNERMQALESTRNEKRMIEDAINKTKMELFSLSSALKKNTVELKSLKEKQIALTSQIPEQKKKVLAAAPDKAKVAQLNSRLAKAQKCFEKANAAASEIDEKVQSIHTEMVGITKGKYGNVQKGINKLTKEIDNITANVTKCKVSSKTATRNLKKTEEKIEGLQAEIAEVKTSRERLMIEFKDLESNATKVLQRKQAVEVEIGEWEAKRQAILQEVAAIKEEESKLKSLNVELRNKVKDRETVVKQKQDVCKGFKAKIKGLKLQEIDDDDDADTESPKSLPNLTDEEIESTNENTLVYKIGTIEAEMEKIKPNMAAISEFRTKEAIYKKKVDELNVITKERDNFKKLHDDLRKQRLAEFMTGYKIITSKLKEVYQMITLGGDAELELVDSLDPFTEGIIFSVRPPKKSWKNISNLSGGEKTLSSLALVFALHYYKPTPFYVMDEIDAALDFKNVSIVGNYIKERTKNAQFIIISLRNNMFELADRLVGIFKVDNCTKSATIAPHELAEKVDKAGTEEVEEERIERSIEC